MESLLPTGMITIEPAVRSPFMRCSAIHATLRLVDPLSSTDSAVSKGSG